MTNYEAIKEEFLNCYFTPLKREALEYRTKRDALKPHYDRAVAILNDDTYSKDIKDRLRNEKYFLRLEADYHSAEYGVKTYCPIVKTVKKLLMFKSTEEIKTQLKIIDILMGTYSAHWYYPVCRSVAEMNDNFDSPIEALFYYAFDLEKNNRNFNTNIFKLIPQHEIGRYRVDFLIKPLNGFEFEGDSVVIEIDGHDFHEKTKEQVRHDKERERFIQSQGYKVFRFSGSEVFRNPMKCVGEMWDYIENHRKSTYEYTLSDEEMIKLIVNERRDSIRLSNEYLDSRGHYIYEWKGCLSEGNGSYGEDIDIRTDFEEEALEDLKEYQNKHPEMTAPWRIVSRQERR